MITSTLTLKTSLKELNIPHLEVVLEEIFGVPNGFLGIQTVEDLIATCPIGEKAILFRLKEAMRLSSLIEISSQELAIKMSLDVNSLFLLDVRERSEYNIAHIPSSIHIEEIDFTVLIQELKLNKGKEVITICWQGCRAYSAAMYLQQQGITKARSLAGGFQQWRLHSEAT